MENNVIYYIKTQKICKRGVFDEPDSQRRVRVQKIFDA